MGGIIDLDGQPLSPDAIRTLELCAANANGELSVWWDRHIAFVCASHEGEQLLAHRKTGDLDSPVAVLCWNGRLDNGEELRSQTGYERPPTNADADLVLAAYEKWGSSLPEKLVGDFALCAWDSRNNRLSLVRDLFGTRTLYYGFASHYFVWSTSLRAAHTLAKAGSELSEDYVATYLIGQPEPHLSPYKEILAVPPGHVLSLERGTRILRRFWRVDPGRSLNYKNDAEYEEHFRHLFRQAVRCRLQSEGAVCAELSGGLDSSSIVCMADEVIGAGEAQASSLHTVSYVFEQSATSDEQKYISYIERQRGERGLHIGESEQRIFKGLLSGARKSVPDPLDCFPGRESRLLEEMQKRGSRVLLSGHGGDHVLLTGLRASPELSDLLIRGKFSQLARSLGAWSTALKAHRLGLLYEGAIEPVLPRFLRRAFLGADVLPAWIHPRLVKRANLKDKALGPVSPSALRLPSKRVQASMLEGAAVTTASGPYQDMTSATVSYPFQDQRLAEFLLAIPPSQILRPGQNRSIQRRALRNLLPQETIRRKGKKGPTEAILRALSLEWDQLQALLDDAQIYERGFVNKEAFQATLTRCRMGQVATPILLAGTLALESWLKLGHKESPVGVAHSDNTRSGNLFSAARRTTGLCEAQASQNYAGQ